MPKQSIERKISTAERNEELLQKEDSALEDKFGDQVKREREKEIEERKSVDKGNLKHWLARNTDVRTVDQIDKKKTAIEKDKNDWTTE